jgi:hypothetical protein
MIRRIVKLSFLLVFTMVLGHVRAQNSTQQKVDQLIEKKAEYHKLTNGEMDGYRIKIHFGIDQEVAKNIRSKFSAKFNDFSTDVQYQQPNFVVLVGDFKTKLEAFEALKKIQVEFANAFIVKGKIRAKI